VIIKLRVFFWLFLQGVFAWIPCLLKLRLVTFVFVQLLIAGEFKFRMLFSPFPVIYLYEKIIKM